MDQIYLDTINKITAAVIDANPTFHSEITPFDSFYGTGTRFSQFGRIVVLWIHQPTNIVVSTARTNTSVIDHFIPLANPECFNLATRTIQNWILYGRIYGPTKTTHS